MSIVGTESKYKDYKGQEVIHSLPIRTSTLEGEIVGESNKRPGQYDWMFSDSSWYPEEAKREIGSYLFVLISTQIKEIQYFYPILRLEYMQYISVLCNLN